jgi:hypothetical protein
MPLPKSTLSSAGGLVCISRQKDSCDKKRMQLAAIPFFGRAFPFGSGFTLKLFCFTKK